MKKKVISYERTTGVNQRKVSMIGDLNRAEYQIVGASPSVLAKTAIVLFCSGNGTRLVTGNFTKSTIPLPIPSRKTPLELLLRSLPKSIGQIIISVLPDDETTMRYLKDNAFFGLPEDKFGFVPQFMVKPEGDVVSAYPGGAGYVFEKVMQDAAVLDDFVENIIFIDGDKMCLDMNVLLQFIGYHEVNNRLLSVATYPLIDDASHKYAHVDTGLDRAFSGKQLPVDLKEIASPERHQLGAGAYIVRKGLSFLPLKSEVEEKVGVSFEEKPMIAVVSAVAAKNPLWGNGYFQVIPGDLGQGIKDRQTLQVIIKKIKEKQKILFQEKGWNVGDTVTIERYNQNDDDLKVSPNNTLETGSSLFLSGPSDLGKNNTFIGQSIILGFRKPSSTP